jgi:hypothetical protein
MNSSIMKSVVTDYATPRHGVHRQLWSREQLRDLFEYVHGLEAEVKQLRTEGRKFLGDLERLGQMASRAANPDANEGDLVRALRDIASNAHRLAR